jgi:hypothetical protein
MKGYLPRSGDVLVKGVEDFVAGFAAGCVDNVGDFVAEELVEGGELVGDVEELFAGVEELAGAAVVPVEWEW